MTDSTITADREELFAKLADPATTLFAASGGRVVSFEDWEKTSESKAA